MFGLIKKDLIVMKRNFKPFQLLIIMVSIVPLSQNPQFALPLFSSIIVFFLSMLATSTFSYDETAKWNRYEPALPFSRGKIVASKYILAIIFTLVSTLISLLISFIITIYSSSSYFQVLFASSISLFLALIYFSIMLPLIYKFGIETGRTVLYIIILLPISVATLFGMLKIKVSYSFINSNYFLPTLCIIIVLMFFLSYKLSIKIYSNKEF